MQLAALASLIPTYLLCEQYGTYGVEVETCLRVRLGHWVMFAACFVGGGGLVCSPLMYLVFWCLLRERERERNNQPHQQPLGGGSTLSVTVRSFWVTNKSTLVCLSLDRIPILFPLCVPVIIQSLFYFPSQRYYFSHQWTSPIQPAYSDKQTRRRGDTPQRYL
ncbi:hypothetical protein L873DRAFT_525696 [Choiromyces venosus 120613-1]|uniref:Uncharacterized protein n=1 Tax=Choiromyces venosus 120613-1 TaxID=1336337 RepID=A0A3N4K531_9PEZI|nr:hypothetical protein L873DRAFT_525696 [Choiromyces venosus 120613-1]